MATKRLKRKPKPHQQRTASSPSDFSFTIGRVAVAQICRSIGYKRGQRAALDALTLVAIKYIQTLAQSASSFCNASSRSESNLLDLTVALHDLTVIHDGGFTGASALHSCLSGSSVMKSLARFVLSSEETPFAKPIDRLERQSNGAKEPQFGTGISIKAPHIPDWLPSFPDFDSKEKCERAQVAELWENSDSVLGKEKKEMYRERDYGELMKERERVKFAFGARRRLDSNGRMISEVGKKQVDNVEKRKRQLAF